MRWKDKSDQGKACQLEIVDEFRSFVKPTWRPQLSQFCTDLTGITQVRPMPSALMLYHDQAIIEF
jgi:3'-5' exoribonuclease 1